MATSYISKSISLAVTADLDYLTEYILDQSAADLSSLAGTAWGSTNKRKIILDKNRFTQEVTASTPSGTTYGTFLISSTPRYLGGSASSEVINTLTAEDFKNFDIGFMEAVTTSVKK